MTMIRVGVDVDGVLRDFVGSLMRVYRKTFPDHTIIERSKWDWHLLNNFPDFGYGKETLYEWIFTDEVARDIMVNAEMIGDANKIYNDLQDQMADRAKLVIVSHQYENIVHHTSEWLGKHGFKAQEIWYGSEKLGAGCDVLIDDNPKNLWDYQEAGKIALAVKQPWNRNYGSTRLDSFAEASKFVSCL